jgi:YcaO-like protein with predicted kinase domain
MGITRLGNLTGLDRIGIPVTVAVRPNSRSVSVSQGKGVDLPQALASAMMEAVELFHGEDIAAHTRVASYRELASVADAVRPHLLCGTGVPLPEDAEIAWIEGHDLLRRKNCWVPWEIVHTDYTFATDHSGNHFLSGTNGLASGNHILEALSSGICELVERDAVALWNARHLWGRANCLLDLASVDDRDCCALLETYQRAHVTVRVWDVTSDVGIPAFVCDIPAARDDPAGGLRRFRGSGCHPNRTVALARALTEAAQVRLTYIAGIRDDLSDYEESAPQKLGAALLDAASQSAEPRSFHDTPNFDTDDLAHDVRWQLGRLRSVGIERIIAIDLTRSDFGIPVVRVVIPGLEWDCTHPDYIAGPRARSINGSVE